MTKMKNHRFNNIERHERLMERLADTRLELASDDFDAAFDAYAGRAKEMELGLTVEDHDSLEAVAGQFGDAISTLIRRAVDPTGGDAGHDCDKCSHYDICDLPQKKPLKKNFN